MLKSEFYLFQETFLGEREDLKQALTNIYNISLY